MGWFKNFVDGLKDAWNELDKQREEERKQEEIERKKQFVANVGLGLKFEDIYNEDGTYKEEQEQEQLTDEREQQLKQNITNKLALANLGVERYGRPTIIYKGKTYNSKMLLNLLDNKNNLTMDDIIMCKMMIFKIKEQIDMIAKRDEDGEILRHTDDEVLDTYLMFARNDVCMLEYLLKKDDIK